MSDITRDDLWVNCNHSYCDGVDDEDAHRRLSDEEFDRLAIERAEELGYVLRTWDLAEHMAKAWIEGESAKALRALLTDECDEPDCENGMILDDGGRRKVPEDWTPHFECGGRGWLPNGKAYGLIDWLADSLNVSYVSTEKIIVNWLEAEDE